MYINIKGDECKNHVIVNCILMQVHFCTRLSCIYRKIQKKFKARLLSFMSGLPFKNKNPTGTKKNNISIGI